MTKEDAIKIFNTVLCFGKCDCTKDEIEECLKMAIEALKTQPCNDCIRRSDVTLTNLEILMCNGDYKEALKMLLDKIEKAPSVTPQPKEEPQQKTGHWIEHQGTFRPHIECSECSCWFLREDLPRNSYCPNCGSRNHWKWELKTEGEQK